MIDVFLVPLLLLLKAVLGLAIWVVVADVVISWLFVANVFNPQNRFIIMITDTLSRLSEIMLAPVRKHVPYVVGSMDLSPVILILILTFLENVLTRILMKIV